MNKTSLFCLLSATIGALAATAYHQTDRRREANAQEPGRAPLLRGVEAPPLPPAAVKEWRLAFAHRTKPWSEKDIDAPQR